MCIKHCAVNNNLLLTCFFSHKNVLLSCKKWHLVIITLPPHQKNLWRCSYVSFLGLNSNLYHICPSVQHRDQDNMMHSGAPRKLWHLLQSAGMLTGTSWCIQVRILNSEIWIQRIFCPLSLQVSTSHLNIGPRLASKLCVMSQITPHRPASFKTGFSVQLKHLTVGNKMTDVFDLRGTFSIFFS